MDTNTQTAQALRKIAALIDEDTGGRWSPCDDGGISLTSATEAIAEELTMKQGAKAGQQLTTTVLELMEFDSIEAMRMDEGEFWDHSSHYDGILDNLRLKAAQLEEESA